MTNVFAAQAADGVQVSGSVVGAGPPVVLLAGGIDYDARSWTGVVHRLSRHHTIFGFVRRRYRPELGDPFQWSIREDTQDVAAVAALSSEPVALLAHSSGGVLALECLAADQRRYRAAAIFEAPIVTDSPLDRLHVARRQLRDGRRGRAPWRPSSPARSGCHVSGPRCRATRWERSRRIAFGSPVRSRRWRPSMPLATGDPPTRPSTCPHSVSGEAGARSTFRTGCALSRPSFRGRQPGRSMLIMPFSRSGRHSWLRDSGSSTRRLADWGSSRRSSARGPRGGFGPVAELGQCHHRLPCWMPTSSQAVCDRLQRPVLELVPALGVPDDRGVR